MLDEFLCRMQPVVNSHIEEFLPRRFEKIWLEENLGELRYGYNNESFERIAEPIWELIDRGGKRWRPIFMMLCCDVLGGGSKIKDLVPVIEILHNGTLVMDDIEDSSSQRRGKPTLHKMYGIDVAVNSGNMMYYLPYVALKNSELSPTLKLKVHEVIAEEMLKLHFGQGLDIHWHNDGSGIDEQMYLQMCSFKTGTLARMAAKIGAMLGKATPRQVNSVVRFAESMGVAFQIQDDILNITSRDWGKEFGDDITEGKRTLMVIKVMEEGTKKDRERLLSILNIKTKDPKLIGEALSIMERYKAIDYAKEKARSMVMEAWDELKPLIPESGSKDKLGLFADFVISRKI